MGKPKPLKECIWFVLEDRKVKHKLFDVYLSKDEEVTPIDCIKSAIDWYFMQKCKVRDSGNPIYETYRMYYQRNDSRLSFDDWLLRKAFEDVTKEV